MDKNKILEALSSLSFPTTVTTVSDIGDNMNIEFKVDCEAEDFETWLKEFENITKTSYTIRKKSSKGHLYERTLYATCHHNTYGKLPSNENFKYGSKNTQCPAKIQMKKSRPFLNDLKTSTLISVHFHHNHPILAADSFRFRKPSKQVEEKFLNLFQSGHTPASSIQAHNLDIILENPDDYEVILSDNSLSPNYQWVSRLHKKVADSNYGSNRLTNIEQAELIRKLASEKDCCCKIVEDGNQVAVVLVTRMMLRISLMPELAESCFVDSSGGIDRDGTRFFVLLGRCHAGGVPLAIVLATSENQNILAGAFKAIQELLPKDAFGGRSNLVGPLTFLTDDCAAERNALRQVWPDSTVLLCAFNVLQALWRWLFDKKHSIELKDRSRLLTLFKVIMYAQTEEKLEYFYEALLQDPCANKYPNYLKHIISYMDRRTEWALFYRDKLLVRGNNTNNLCESAMMIMKDYILQRVKAYNIVQVADFVISRFDLYFEQKILKVAFNRLTNKYLCKMAYLRNNVEFARGKIIEEGNVYSVPSEKDASKWYSVNMDLAHCECSIGKDGRLCKHQVAVAKFMDVSNLNIMPLNDPKQKQYLYYIATGKEMKLDFFQSLRTHAKEEASSSKLEISSSKSDLGIMDNNVDVLNDESDLNAIDSTFHANVYYMDFDLVDESPKQGMSDTQLTIIEAEENLTQIFNDILTKVKEKPDIYLSAIQAFSKKYNCIKTDANLVSSFDCFGKSLNESTTSTSVYAVKRRGKKIHVQPTSVARRRNLHLGRATSSSANAGRPHRRKELKEHNYASNRRLTKAPHSLASCVANNVSTGR